MFSWREEALSAIKPMLTPEPGDCQSEAELARLEEEDRRLSQAAAQLSEDVLRKVWDNPEDAEYDALGSGPTFTIQSDLKGRASAFRRPERIIAPRWGSRWVGLP